MTVVALRSNIIIPRAHINSAIWRRKDASGTTNIYIRHYLGRATLVQTGSQSGWSQHDSLRDAIICIQGVWYFMTHPFGADRAYSVKLLEKFDQNLHI